MSRLPPFLLSMAASLLLALPAQALDTPEEECAYGICEDECEQAEQEIQDLCLQCATTCSGAPECAQYFPPCPILQPFICDLIYNQNVQANCNENAQADCIHETVNEGVCDVECDQVCQATLDLAERANTQYGATKVHEAASKKRLRPSSLEQELRTLLEALNDGGCTVQPTLQDDAAGAYHLGTRVVDLHASNAAGPQQGTVRKAVKNLEGPIGPDQYGSAFSTWNDNGRFVADRSDGGFLAGRWVRTTGKRGVFVAAQGACDGSATPAEALETWLGADLSGWP